MRLACFAYWVAMCGAWSMWLPTAAAVPFAESGTDRVRLKTGKTIEGIVVWRQRDGVWVAIERSWLEKNHPELARRWSTEAERDESQRRRLTRQRIADWLRERADWNELQAFLKSEQQRLEKPVGEPHRFLLHWFPRRRIRFLKSPPAERRQIYMAAWVAGIDDVSNQTVDQLAKKLDSLHIAPQAVRPDEFWTLLPPKPDSEIEWQVRQALVEWQYGGRLAFQGTPDFWIAVDEQGQLAGAGNGGLERLANEILGGGILGERGRRASPLARAVKQAREQGVRGFLVKELHSGAMGVPSEVEVQFYVVLDSGNAASVINVKQPVKPADEGAARQLEQDPKIAELLKTIRSLGLPVDGDRLQFALGIGAGVQQALREADAKFVTGQQLYARSLDVPLWLPE